VNPALLLGVGAVMLIASSAPPVKRQVQIATKTRPVSDKVTLEELIFAIGTAEGWGVRRSRSTFVMAVHNPRTIAPFGLLGDTARYPALKTDAPLLYEFMVGKLTGRILPRVAALGVQGFSATVVAGLVRADGSVDISKISDLQRKWAPLEAANDPRGLNANWLNNVRSALGYRRLA
jgi:hypothetical protein